jgi:cell division protein FtsB
MGDPMRHLITSAACAAVLLLATACGNGSNSASDTSDTSSTASSATASASPTVDVAANTTQVCTAVKQYNTDYSTKITAVFAKVTDAALKHIDEMNALAKEWVSNLQAQAAKASNPELQKTVNDLATGVAKLESGDASMNDMNNTVQIGNANLAKLCG